VPTLGSLGDSSDDFKILNMNWAAFKFCTQLRASEIARAYGFTPRHWIRLAAVGKIPGARQPSGAKGQWLFDAEVFAKWWESRQREVMTWPGYTVEEKKSGGVAFSVKVESTAEAYRQQTAQLLKNVLGIGSRRSRPLRGVTGRDAHSRTRTTDSFVST
jgi:hypothetical protein